ncbi:MAG TPA: hypothetical protein VJM11_00070, partial [Nevskiaceae bacterium]|nr:hypothetical protein [Nevskiaceae bacterium]
MHHRSAVRRPRRERGGWVIWVALLVILVGAVAGGALVGLWVFRNVDARLMLREQPALVTIDEKVVVT